MAQDAPKKYRKKKLGSYPFVSVVFSITLSLFVIGLFGLLVSLSRSLTNVIKENIEVQVYLDQDISNNQRIKINKLLSTQDFVVKGKDGISKVNFISKEEAAEDFVGETGENFQEFLDHNPLRDLFVIHISPIYQTANNLETIKQKIEGISGVYEVTYVQNFIESINKNLTKVGLILIGFAAILLFTVVILINNTIKLALFSQRFLIRSMQLVGAKHSFIQKPFLTRSMGHGALAGVLASLLLTGALRYGTERIEELGTLVNWQENLIIFGGLIITGVLIGLLSTYRAVNKYLKMSLDDLY